MPIVRIELLPGRTDEVKQALADRITIAFQEVCGTNPAVVEVIFQTVEGRDWFVGGTSYAAPRERPEQTE
jgi:4-oxalocrotonate tautomerase